MRKTFVLMFSVLLSVLSGRAELLRNESSSFKRATVLIKRKNDASIYSYGHELRKLFYYHQLHKVKSAQQAVQSSLTRTQIAQSFEWSEPEINDKRLNVAVKAINKQIDFNNDLLRTDRNSETSYIVDLRASTNSAAFLDDEALLSMNQKLQVINQNSSTDETKPACYVLLNMFFPADEDIQSVSGLDKEAYLKKYTQELYDRSQLSANGILLNIESFLSIKELRTVFDEKEKTTKEKPTFTLTYHPFVGIGSKLKDSSYDALIEGGLTETSKNFEFAVQGASTSANKPHRADVLSAYVSKVAQIIEKISSGGGSFFEDETNSEFFVELELNDVEKSELEKVLAEPNTSPSLTSNLKDYAGVSNFLQRLFGNYYSRLFSEPEGLNLKVITTSAYNTHKGQNAIQLVKEETLNPNTLLLGLHFLDTPNSNSEKVSIRFTAKYGSQFDKQVKEQLDNVWEDIGLLKWTDQIKDIDDKAYSDFIFILDAASEFLEQIRIPKTWWDGDNWYNLDPFASGVINGILDDVTGLLQLVVLGGKASASIAHFGVQIRLFAYELATNDTKRTQVLAELEEIKENLFPILKNGALGFITFFSELEIPDTTLIQDFQFFFPKGLGYGLTAEEQLTYINNIEALNEGDLGSIKELVVNFSPFVLALNSDAEILKVAFAFELGKTAWEKVQEMSAREIEYYTGYAAVQVALCFVGVTEIVAIVKGANAAAKTFKLADDLASGLKAIKNSGEKTLAGFITRLKVFLKSFDKTLDTAGLSRVKNKLKAGSISLDEFLLLSKSDKRQRIKVAWDASYPQIFFERKLFEDVMGHYRYAKSSWGHTNDIASNFKAIDFYEKGSVSGNNIFTETAVSMKTTTTTDVSKWLNSSAIKKNLDNLDVGIEAGITWNGKTIFYNKAEVHIYLPKEKFTENIKTDWLNTLKTERPSIQFKINTIDEFIQ